ncbi:hypothetical protein BC943DRAFT_272895 [Umbelopsis sp. AD052]|nr:hypothetical protein BC943DRAFT_272895 [Umbelopsis sp. AD052]
MEPVSPQAPDGPFSIHGSSNDLERDENNHRRRSYITPTAAPKLEEYRKIIHHIATKLRKRKRPPPYAFAELNSSQQTVFDNEDVADLLSQLRDVLQICTKAGWTLKTVIDISFDGGSPKGANFPLEKSMKNGEIPFIAEILADVVLNDCRYQVAIPKPSRPSYALHSITIDLAILLVQQDTRNLAWLFEIGMLMLPAFDTFPPGPLIGKLMVLYIDWIIPNLIKAHAPTYLFEYSINVSNSQNAHSGAPTINIQQPEREISSARRNGSGLTIQTSRNVQMRSSHDPSLVRRSSSVSGSHSGDLSIDSYYTYALFSPLLLLMIQNLNPYVSAKRSSSLPKASVDLLRESSTLFQFYQALDFMISQKNDIYLDLLDIISYGNEEVRSRATQILFHYYGKSLGHITVAEPLAKLGHREQMIIAESENREERDREERDRMAVIEAMRAGGTVDPDEDDENHIFFPHMFPEARQRSSQGIAMLNIQSTNDDQSSNCRECFKIIKGYGLKCYTCRDGLHYNCFNQKMSTNLLDILHYVNDGGVHKVVSPQYCTIRSTLRKVPAFASGNSSTKLPAFFKNQISLDIHGHEFQLVNLFTLTLCLCCRLPLWGISYQGYQCTKCNRFAHLDCLFSNHEQGSNTLSDCRPAPFTEKDISIERRKLEDDFVQNYNDMLIKAENMHNTSFEEVSSLLNILLLQENILHCGTSAGCLVVIESDTNPLATQDNGKGQSGGVNDNISDKLRMAIERCTSYLSNGDPKASTFLNDLSIVNHYHVSDMIFSDDLYLSHIAAMLKAQSNRSHFDGDGNGSMLSTSPRRRSIISSTGYLQVSTNSRNRQVAGGDYDHVEENLTPNEMLHSQSMLDWVQSNLKITSASLARLFLQHLSDVGLFERLDGMPLVFLESRLSRIRKPSSAIMDTISVPCIFTAPFAIDSSPSVESLITAILACLTDMSLSINEYGLLLLTRRCWPDPFTSAYTWERLIYATLKWVYQEDEQLSVIHAEYTAKGQQGAGVSKNRWQVAAQAALMSKNRGGFLTKNRQSVQQQNQSGVGMGTGGIYVSMRNVLRDKYLAGWMSAVYDLNRDTFGDMIFEMTKRIVLEKKEEGKFSSPMESLSSMKTLQRLCHQKGSSSTGSSDNRLSIYANSVTSDDNSIEGLLGKQLEQPYKLIVGTFDNENFEDFAKGINWIKLLMHSGVGIPALYLAKMSRKLAVAHAPLSLQVDMLKCIWYQCIKGLNTVTSRSSIRDVVGYLNECALPGLQQMAQQHDITNDDLQNAQDFIKYSAALTCFAYKCPMSNVVELQIVPYVNQHVPTQP